MKNSRRGLISVLVFIALVNVAVVVVVRLKQQG